MRYAIRQIELDVGYMPKAPDVELMLNRDESERV